MKVLRQSLFARRDYEGLSKESAEKLKQIRDNQAKILLKERRNLNKELSEKLAQDTKKKKWSINFLRRDGVKNVESFKDLDNYYISKRGRSFNTLLKSSKNQMNLERDSLQLKDLINEKDSAVKTKSKSVSPKNVKTIDTTPGFFKRNKKALLIGGGVAALGGAGLMYAGNRKKRKQIDDSRRSILGE